MKLCYIPTQHKDKNNIDRSDLSKNIGIRERLRIMSK